jgi:hypothetical protein
MKGCGLLLIFLVVFGGIGCGMIYFGYQAKPGDLTDDGFPLKYFLYAMGGFFVATPLIMAFFMTLVGLINKRKDAYFATYGVPATATILSIEDTGTRINDNPRVALSLRIERGGQQPYTINTTKTVSIVYLGRLVPNAKLAVLVDSKDTNRIKIEWNKPII